ncbi:MAG: UDP-N-acetylglucosamine-1-phosphate transferase [Halobacteriota archaeon]|nr:UDP-N-acetylglucosamine-1-phosphate transferase [Halobacteriota archaeon]
MPYYIRKLTESGFTVIDYYKKDKPMVATKGGLLILFVSLVLVSVGSLTSEFPSATFRIVTVLTLFALAGILDDLINIGRPAKLVMLYLFSFPLVGLIDTSIVTLPIFGSIDFGILYILAVVPIYVMVTANLVNMHSGFNGLAAGTSSIILVTLLIKSVMTNQTENIVAITFITGATFAFLWYNRNPSKIFLGNIGALTLGSAIGILIVLQGFLISGFVMLIPHVINFLMYVYWRARRLPQAKFGEVRDDGTIKAPNPLTLKWALPYYRKVTEKTATYVMFLLTAVFCGVGLFIPG